MTVLVHQLLLHLVDQQLLLLDYAAVSWRKVHLVPTRWATLCLNGYMFVALLGDSHVLVKQLHVKHVPTFKLVQPRHIREFLQTQRALVT